MMTGSVIALHLLLKVPFQAANGTFYDVECVVDTGFTGFLTLPPQDVETLGLPHVRTMGAYLADNSLVRISVHRAAIRWQDQEREVEMLAMGVRPLLGTLLLASHKLFADFVENGLLQVDV